MILIHCTSPSDIAPHGNLTNGSNGSLVMVQNTNKRGKGKDGYAYESPAETVHNGKDDYERKKNIYLHRSWVMYDLQFGVSLNDLRGGDVDPTKVARTIKTVRGATFFSSPSQDTIHDDPIMPMAVTRVRRIPLRPRAKVALSNLYELGDPSLLSNNYETITFEDFCQGKKMDLASYTNRVQEPPIVLDTGASTSLTPVLSDFVGELTKPTSLQIKGLSSSARVVGVGTVEWTIVDLWGVVRVIRTTAYHVPDASIRLFSPHTYFQDNNDKGKCVIEARKAILHMPDGSILEFPYNRGNNLPLMLTDDAHFAGLTKRDNTVSPKCRPVGRGTN